MGRSSLGLFDVSDFIQMACVSKRSLKLGVSLEDGRFGIIEIFEGDIWNVSMGDTLALDALLSLLFEPASQPGQSHAYA